MLKTRNMGEETTSGSMEFVSLEAQLPPKTKLHKIQKAALIALSGVAKVKTRGEILMPLAPTH